MLTQPVSAEVWLPLLPALWRNSPVYLVFCSCFISSPCNDARKGFLHCQTAPNPLLFSKCYTCLQEGQVLFVKTIFGGQVWLNFSGNITETQQKMKVMKMPVQTIPLPLNPLVACSCPEKGLLGQAAWHCLQTRHAVRHPSSFPNRSGTPHGSTSHDKGQGLVPGAHQ